MVEGNKKKKRIQNEKEKQGEGHRVESCRSYGVIWLALSRTYGGQQGKTSQNRMQLG